MELQTYIDEKKLTQGFVDIGKAMQIAGMQTLNIQAALTRRNSHKEVENEFTLRNTFTKRNIQFQKTELKKISDMQSSAGATERADYLELQHMGGLRRPKAGSKLAIAQSAARGGTNRRLVSREFYIKKIKNQTVKGKTKFRSKKAAAVAGAYVAYKQKKFFKHNENIYKVTSFRKSKGGQVRFKKKHFYNVSERTTKVKRNPWLYRSSQQPAKDGQSIYNSQVKKLLRQKNII